MNARLTELITIVFLQLQTRRCANELDTLKGICLCRLQVQER